MEEGKLFNPPRMDISQAHCNLKEQAKIAHDIEESRADRVSWLVSTGFPTHPRGLRNAEIKMSYILPPKKVLDRSNCEGCTGA